MDCSFTKHQYQGRLSKFIEMTITVKYLGLIADITNSKEEVFASTDSSLSTESLVKNLIQTYNGLGNASFVIAVNKKLVTSDLKLNDNDTVALLPPFAGG